MIAVIILILTLAVVAVNGLEHAKYAKQEAQPVPKELAAERHGAAQWI